MFFLSFSYSVFWYGRRI